MCDHQSVSEERETSDELLIATLDHVTRWVEFRVGTGAPIVNSYLISVAVLAAAYASALDAKEHLVAGSIGVLAMIVSVAAFLGGRRQRHLARAAHRPLLALQQRLAERLALDDLQMAKRAHRERGTISDIVLLVLCFAVVVAAGAAVYGWFFAS